MKKRRLGHDGPEVSAIGLGCMGMSEFYGHTDDAESRTVLFRALEEGITFFDTAESYGHGHNEELLGSVLREWKGDAVVATKFGIVRKPGEYERRIDNSGTYIRTALEAKGFVRGIIVKIPSCNQGVNIKPCSSNDYGKLAAG